MTEYTITKRAEGKAITLAELRAFVAELDHAGAPEETPIQARGGWSGSKVLTAELTRDGAL